MCEGLCARLHVCMRVCVNICGGVCAYACVCMGGCALCSDVGAKHQPQRRKPPERQGVLGLAGQER
jgi:hypothetical protein